MSTFSNSRLYNNLIACTVKGQKESHYSQLNNFQPQPDPSDRERPRVVQLQSALPQPQPRPLRGRGWRWFGWGQRGVGGQRHLVPPGRPRQAQVRREGKDAPHRLRFSRRVNHPQMPCESINTIVFHISGRRYLEGTKGGGRKGGYGDAQG